LLHERTEGWAAGLRLAALSLAGHPDPERFAAGFSGSERTVAEYLLAEVLDRQPTEVRRLLLRTSVLERVNGELADLLTGGPGGVRVLQESFRRHVGMSPLTYLRRLRLDGVHGELSRSDPWHVSVSEVAYRWGFTHLGRFAGAYRKRYGEPPSQTLRERS